MLVEKAGDDGKGMPIESPAFMVSISIKGDCYMNFNLMVISILVHLEQHVLRVCFCAHIVSEI